MCKGVNPLDVTISMQSFVAAAAFCGAVVALATYFSKIVRWVDRQEQQDEEIKKLRQHHDNDMDSIKEEQTLLMYGVLACLKGLNERGCTGLDGVISDMETYLNKKAHK